MARDKFIGPDCGIAGSYGCEGTLKWHDVYGFMRKLSDKRVEASPFKNLTTETAV